MLLGDTPGFSSGSHEVHIEVHGPRDRKVMLMKLCYLEFTTEQKQSQGLVSLWGWAGLTHSAAVTLVCNVSLHGMGRDLAKQETRTLPFYLDSEIRF